MAASHSSREPAADSAQKQRLLSPRLERRSSYSAERVANSNRLQNALLPPEALRAQSFAM
jgi:hypothetical protein